MTKRDEQRLKAFGMSTQMLLEDLAQLPVGQEARVIQVMTLSERADAVYYPQFDAAIRDEAARMAQHYETFYSLEKSIRTLVTDTLTEAEKTPDWWASPRIPINVKTEVSTRTQKELDAGVTRRSLQELDYTTFGELSVIISSNWDVFGALFSSKRAVEKVMASLNALRNPIAHCSPLAEDEVLRLQLTVRDWFRLME